MVIFYLCVRLSSIGGRKAMLKIRDQKMALVRGFRPVAVLVSFLLLAGACGSDEPAAAPEEAAEKIDIWVVGSIQVGGTFWDQIEAGAKAAGEMIADAEVTYIAPEEYSYPNIDAMIQTAVAANPDAVLVDYRSSDFEGTVVGALNQGIEVQFFNNFVGTDSADPRIRRLSATAVGLDKAAASKRSANLYTEFVSPGDSLVLFNSLPDSSEHLEIQNAYVEVFLDAGWSEDDLDIVDLPGLDPAPNFEAIKTYLAAYPDVDGIVTWDTSSGTPAAQAKADIGSSVPLVMWNLDQTVISGVKDGTVQLSLTQQPFLQTYYAVVSAYLKVKYGLIDPAVIDPGTLIVNADNVDEVEGLFNAGYVG